MGLGWTAWPGDVSISQERGQPIGVDPFVVVKQNKVVGFGEAVPQLKHLGCGTGRSNQEREYDQPQPIAIFIIASK